MLVVVGDDEADTVPVPPVRETELDVAAGQSRCVLVNARAGERVNPPVDGPAGGRAARAGFYEQPVATAQLTAAVRKGIIVIQFRSGLDEKRVEALKALQSAFPEGTIVAPNATGMRFELAVVAYRRLLGCPRFTDQFAGRGAALPRSLPRLRPRVGLTPRRDPARPAGPVRTRRSVRQRTASQPPRPRRRRFGACAGRLRTTTIPRGSSSARCAHGTSSCPSRVSSWTRAGSSSCAAEPAERSGEARRLRRAGGCPLRRDRGRARTARAGGRAAPS